MRVLNVGGGGRGIKLPPHYEGYEQVRLDIDPLVSPDIVCDARKLDTLDEKFDAVYSSHVLEHFYDHEVPVVLRGMRGLLLPGGWVEARVPDARAVCEVMITEGRDLDWTLYHSGSGPITIGDVLWGSHRHHLYTGGDYQLHRTGFSSRLLTVALSLCGFPFVFGQPLNYELRALGFLQEPSEELRAMLGVEHGE